MTLDMDMISVYKFIKELEEHSGNPTEELDAKFYIENVSNKDKSLLQELGVRNSAVLLANCTIWVEGITDRFYLRRFLKLYQESDSKLKTFKEDIHYSFVEYSGSNITHWSFLDKETLDIDDEYTTMKAERVCGTLLLISDKDSDNKIPRQEILREALGERYYCLECKEIENVLSADVIRGVISEYEQSTLDHLIDKEFNQEDYSNIYLGNFINSLFEEGSKKRRGSYAADSGTIASKLDFCKKAIKNITTYDQLSDEAKKISKVLYDFIKSHNE